MSACDVRPLSPAEFPAAAALLARGMRDTPNHIQAFGSDPARREQRLERLFVPVLEVVRSKGELLGAYRAGILCGVLGTTAPGRCQPTPAESLRLLPRMLLSQPPTVLYRLTKWMREWARLDPPEPHWHLGPVAVDRPLQGHGIGSALMSAFCSKMDDLPGTRVAYLETETRQNVRFYERFGFVTVAEATVLGVPNWFMKRSPQAR